MLITTFEVVALAAVEPTYRSYPYATRMLVCGAILLATYLAVALLILGVDKYFYILAGGKKFATFPNEASYLGISLAYVALVVLHGVWVVSHDRPLACRTFANTLQFCWIFLLMAFVAFPLGNDVYLYLHYGLMSLHQVDPFVTPSGDFLSPLTPFVDWKQPSTYGPISQSLFTIAAIAVPTHPLLAIYIFKAICLVTHVGNGFLVWRILPEQDRGKWTIAYLLCPVLLMEQVGSAHVDVFVCTSILLTGMCLFHDRPATAFLTLWGGFLAKTIPIIWMPLLGLFLIRQKRWASLALGIGYSGALVALLWFTFLPTVESWRSLLNPGVTGQFLSSIPALLRAGFETLPYFLADAPPPRVYKYWLLTFSRYLLNVFFIFYAWTCLRVFRRHYSTVNLLEDMGWVTLVLMLYATSWIVPWYVSILYAIAILIPHSHRFGLIVLTFGVSSSAMYLLQQDAGLRSACAIGLPTLMLVISTTIEMQKK